MSGISYFLLKILFGFALKILNLARDHIFQDVAVKILMEQDFHAERFKEFLREVNSNSFLSLLSTCFICSLY